jgi:DNA (cytosine-5)-methyltransferase 1
LILAPPHGKHPKVHTFDKRKSHYGKTNDMRDFVQVTGGGNCTIVAARDAMGIDWMNKNELNEAIPPAYTEFIGRQLLNHLRVLKQCENQDQKNGYANSSLRTLAG